MPRPVIWMPQTFGSWTLLSSFGRSTGIPCRSASLKSPTPRQMRRAGFWAQSTVSADKAASTLLAHAERENTACFTYDAWPNAVRGFYFEWFGEVRGMNEHSVTTDDESWSLRFSDGESEVLVVRTRLLDRRPVLYLAHPRLKGRHPD